MQRAMPVLAHVGHWIGSLLYVMPVALVAAVIAFRELRDRGRDETGDEPVIGR
jgi:hypothetical protein